MLSHITKKLYRLSEGDYRVWKRFWLAGELFRWYFATMTIEQQDQVKAVLESSAVAGKRE